MKKWYVLDLGSMYGPHITDLEGCADPSRCMCIYLPGLDHSKAQEIVEAHNAQLAQVEQLVEDGKEWATSVLVDNPSSDKVHHPYTAFNQGFRARELGVPKAGNPYYLGNREYGWWTMGYDEAWSQEKAGDTGVPVAIEGLSHLPQSLIQYGLVLVDKDGKEELPSTRWREWGDAACTGDRFVKSGVATSFRVYPEASV